MIGYYTRFTTAPENREAFVAILAQATEAMKTVEGCKLYHVSLDAANPAITCVNELWTDEASHDASLKLDSAKALITQAMPLLTSMPKQAKLGPVITSWLP